MASTPEQKNIAEAPEENSSSTTVLDSESNSIIPLQQPIKDTTDWIFRACSLKPIIDQALKNCNLVIPDDVQSDVCKKILNSESNSIIPTQQPIKDATNDNEECDINDDSKDDDLSDLAIATSLKPLIDQALEDSNVVIPDNQSDVCKKIMIVCSNTAQDIKKSITDVISARESVIVTEEDPTKQLQASLDERIADFEKVVSGCLAAPKTNLNIEITEITDETVESAANETVSVKQDGLIGVDTTGAGDLTKSSHTDSQNSGISGDLTHPHMKGTGEREKDLKIKDETKSGSVSSDTRSSEEKDSVESPVEPTESGSKSSYQKSSDSRCLQETKLSSGKIFNRNEEKNARKQKIISSKKKIEKNIDTIMKSLSTCSSVDEKLSSLCKRHAEAQEDYRLLEPRMKQLERQVVVQQREKEILQADHNRIVLAKSRLEGLCREMQRQNKVIKEESIQRIREEEEKRKEVANKFQATLNDISALMQENSKKNVQLREENSELAAKLKGLVDNYEVWEQNMQKVIQQKELEAQLAKAKHAKVNLLLKQETEKFLREKKSLLECQNELQKRCTLLTQNELHLRNELAEYTAKYEEFQSVLTNSSKVFATFKSDMDATSKKIKKLEKETTSYKQKWANSNNALLEMISYKEKQDKEYANSQQRVTTLEKLCRALQAERNELQNKLNSSSTDASTTAPIENGEPPVVEELTTS